MHGEPQPPDIDKIQLMLKKLGQRHKAQHRHIENDALERMVEASDIASVRVNSRKDDDEDSRKDTTEAEEECDDNEDSRPLVLDYVGVFDLHEQTNAPVIQSIAKVAQAQATPQERDPSAGTNSALKDAAAAPLCFHGVVGCAGLCEMPLHVGTCLCRQHAAEIYDELDVDWWAAAANDGVKILNSRGDVAPPPTGEGERESIFYARESAPLSFERDAEALYEVTSALYITLLNSPRCGLCSQIYSAMCAHSAGGRCSPCAPASRRVRSRDNERCGTYFHFMTTDLHTISRCSFSWRTPRCVAM